MIKILSYCLLSPINWHVGHIATMVLQYCHGNKALTCMISSWNPQRTAFIYQEPNLHHPTSVCLCFCLCLSLSYPPPLAWLSLLSDRPWQGLLRSKDRHIIRELKRAVPAPGGGMTVRHHPGAHLPLDCGNQRWWFEIWIEMGWNLVAELKVLWMIVRWLKRPLHNGNKFGVEEINDI